MSDHLSDQNKSAAELEREVEAQRSRLSSTLDEIQHKMSPGQLLDGFMDYSKGGSKEFVQNLGRSVKENPLPVALVGAGLLWLMTGSGGNNKGHAHHTGGYATGSDGWRSQAYDSGNGSGEGLIGKARHMGEDLAGNVSGAAGSIAEGVSGAAGSVARAAGGLGDSMNRMKHDMGDATRSMFGQMQRQTQNVAHIYEDQPMVGGALAFALGAAIGAILPRTQQEDELVGEVSDSLKEQAMSAAGDLFEEGKHAVSESYAELKEKVAEVVDETAARSDGSASGTGTGAGQYSI